MKSIVFYKISISPCKSYLLLERKVNDSRYKVIDNQIMLSVIKESIRKDMKINFNDCKKVIVCNCYAHIPHNMRDISEVDLYEKKEYKTNKKRTYHNNREKEC